MVCLNTKQSQEKQKPFRIFIGTPYLTEGIEDYKCPIEMLQQMALYGYDPNNLHGVEFLKTPKNNIVKLSTEENSKDMLISDVVNHDLAIVGSAKSVEERVQMIRGSGLVVARYSIFYGKPSGYTGNSPESTGYSLDLPKVVGCATTLMTDDNFLEALVSREETRIRSAIAELNKGKESAPILITPYLSKALEVERSKGGRQWAWKIN